MSNPVDMRALLSKYVGHIAACEGVDYIPSDVLDCPGHVYHSFTEDELAVLHECREEWVARRDAPPRPAKDPHLCPYPSHHPSCECRGMGGDR